MECKQFGMRGLAGSVWEGVRCRVLLLLLLLLLLGSTAAECPIECLLG
jgi:hypothetical protein